MVAGVSTIAFLAEGESRLLPGSEGAYAPFFSPNGGWIAFFANGKLKKVKWTAVIRRGFGRSSRPRWQLG